MLQRLRQDQRGRLGGRQHGPGRRRRLCRGRQLSLSDRPRDLHDHLGWRQYLSAGMREPPDHPSQDRRRRRVRRSQFRSGRGSQSRGAADAGDQAVPGTRRGADVVWQPIAVGQESAALDRLRGGLAAAADRKTLQEAVAGSLLGQQEFAISVTQSRASVSFDSWAQFGLSTHGAPTTKFKLIKRYYSSVTLASKICDWTRPRRHSPHACAYRRGRSEQDFGATRAIWIAASRHFGIAQ